MVGSGLAIAAMVRSSAGTTRGAPAPTTTGSARAPLAFLPREPRRLTFEQGCEEYPSLTPDGATVVFDTSVGDDVHVVAMDIATGVQRRLTTQPGWHFSPAVSPDGKLVAYVRQHEDELGTWLVPLDGSAPARRLVGGRTRPTWSPDGRALWGGAAEKPQRIDLATGQPTRSLDAPPGYLLLRVTELRDGRAIARVFEKETRRGRGLVLYGPNGGPPSTFVADDTEDALAIAPDGQRVLVPKLLATQRVELWQFPLDGSPASLVPGNAASPTKGMAFSRDGSRVVWSTCSTEQDLAALRGAGDKGPLSATPLEPKTEWTDEEPAGVPGSSTRLVVVSDRQSRRQLWVLDVSGAEAPRRLRAGELEVTTPAVSLDATSVAFTAVGHGIHVVPLDGTGDARQLTTGASDTSPTFARDGRAVYFETASATHKRAIARVRLDGSGAPDVVIEGGERPWASPVDERLAYVATDGRARDAHRDEPDDAASAPPFARARPGRLRRDTLLARRQARGDHGGADGARRGRCRDGRDRPSLHVGRSADEHQLPGARHRRVEAGLARRSVDGARSLEAGRGRPGALSYFSGRGPGPGADVVRPARASACGRPIGEQPVAGMRRRAALQSQIDRPARLRLALRRRGRARVGHLLDGRGGCGLGAGSSPCEPGAAPHAADARASGSTRQVRVNVKRRG